MKIKKGMIIFPQNVLVCYDLFIIDLLNRFKSKIKEEDYNKCVNILMECFNGRVVDTPLHKLTLDNNNRLVIVDIMTNKVSSYQSLNKLIYGKHRFITLPCYEYLIKHGYRDLIGLGNIEHKNINCDRLMDQHNNFIVYDNINWDELSIVRSVYGGDESQYINRDDLMNWFKANIEPSKGHGLELTIVSDAFDVDRELAVEAYHKLGMELSRFLSVELRMCCVTPENVARYNECKDKPKDFYRSSIGLYKLWDVNIFK